MLIEWHLSVVGSENDDDDDDTPNNYGWYIRYYICAQWEKKVFAYYYSAIEQQCLKA